jgi:CubicO group peptidase (beta-lactamase class C family)
MKLVEQGRLSLDDRIAEVLHDVVFALGPRCQVSRSYHSYCQRIRELSDDPSLPFAFLLQDYRGDTEPVTVRHHLTHTAQGVPGTTYRYNGFLFGALASVLEKVSGQPFRDLIVEHVTAPLGMTDTVPGATETQEQQVLARQAKYYRAHGSGFEPSDWPPPEWIEAMERCGLDPTPSLNAGAGMISNVLDLAKFDAAMDRDAIVSAQSKALMFTPARSNSGERLPYGLGWFIQDSDNHRLVWHNGHAPGAHSSLLFKVPAADHTLILLANSDGASGPFDLTKGNVLNSPFARLFLHWLP